MIETSFQEYIYSAYPSQNSGTAHSYLKAIAIMDEIFKQNDVFNLGEKTLKDIKDPILMNKIVNYIADEEDKYRAGEKSIFDLGLPTQTSYPRKRFCTAAIRRLGEFVNQICGEEATEYMWATQSKGLKLSKALLKKFQINDKGTEKEIVAKCRIGQNIFRALLLSIYDSKCCLTGIDVPEVLRASHIIPWADRENTRLDPENGLCLSATYDAAFDRHLISFDEDFRLILSPQIKDLYTSEAFRTHFLSYEGKKINLPSLYLPSQEYLETHRSKLAV